MKQFILSFLFFVFGATLMAQVTTSSLSGRVTDEFNDPLLGATVVAIHEPSGSKHGVVTNDQGRFHMQGMRPGGPYKVEVSYVGYQPMIFNNIMLQLGETYQLNVKMKESSISLQEAVIISQKSQEKSGTTTNVSTRQINNLPTINRSISDFTKLSPYAGSGSSFAGQDGRYNNITIDGAAFNNSFGLSSKNLPGGDAQPISLDAIEEISVSVSPYDVKVSNFTGGSVNAVTKSGTNMVKGSVYTFLRPKPFTGNYVFDDIQVPNANSRFSETYGVTVGGPILKNKLFFFVNGEIENQTMPGIAWRASEDGVQNSEKFISRTTVADMRTMSDFLKNTYNYDPGAYENFGDFASKNWKILARLDWNINQANKVTVRFNAVDSRNDQQVNSNSAPNPRGDSRYGIYSMAFGNSNYKFKNTVTSITGEWNSTISSTISNKLLTSFTDIRDTRQKLGSDFPFVDIYKDGKQYMSFGTELFTPHNDVRNKTFQISDNVNIVINDHYLTAGISFESMYFKNSYLRYPLGYYRYDSMEDFMTNSKPNAFGLTYGYGNKVAPGSELTFGMGGLYVQDEWSVTEQFKLTGGIRFDLPFYMNKLAKNNAIKELAFQDGMHIDVSKWPRGRVLFSPRLGFNWDIMGDRSIMLTGGTGLFTGLLPFVWFTNQPTNSGVIQNTLDPLVYSKNENLPADFTFEKDYRNLFTRYPDLFPQEAAETVPGSICVVDRDFKMPQVWRSSLGVDFELPYAFKLSLGAMYTRDVFNVVQKNVNELTAPAKLSGPDNRDFWPQVKTVDANGKEKWVNNNRINSGVSN
ncbi:MAG: TonB-dependent receptor, partial [Bacteroidales bacterium]